MQLVRLVNQFFEYEIKNADFKNKLQALALEH